MIPRSVSASSLESASKCLSMYAATAINRGASTGNDAALLGTTLHAALEHYTDPTLMSSGMWDLQFLIAIFDIHYRENFGPNTKSPWYKQGIEILTNWHNRPTQQSEIQDSVILSREVKSSFMVPYVVDGVTHQVPCNYIIDRLDETEPGKYRVVDYKSQRSPWGPQEMMGKIQVRLYALAIQIMYPKAVSISVQFDYLRYDSVSVEFSKEDNADTWRWLKAAVQRIVDTDINNPPETLNENCRYCIRKLSCNTLNSNVSVGGIFSYDIDTLSERFGEMDSQISGLQSARDEAEFTLLKHAQETGEHEWFTPNSKVKVIIRKTRRVNQERLLDLVGSDVLSGYGRVGINDIEAIRTDARLTPTQRSLLETVIDTTFGEPSIKVSPRGVTR